MQCSKCDAENPEGMKFCGQCGAQLRQAAPDAELRPLSVLFCDLVGSTALAERLEPEELREITGAYHALCGEEIALHEGHVAQYLGDGILAYFGYPSAHEDDARRAVRTALGVLDRLAVYNTRLKEERGLHLDVRIGIHTGPVVVGDVGSGDRREQLALGRTPNVAARIQNLAEPGTVVVSSDTHRIVRGYFDCVELGSRALKGISEEVGLYRVLRESGADSRMDVARRAGLTPLTGRVAEVERLGAEWRGAQREGLRAVCLRGEAGIGKSRLVGTLREQVEREGATVLECVCSPYYQNSPLFPIIAMVERSLGFTRETSDTDKWGALEARLAARGVLTGESLALMAQLLAIPLGDDRAPLDLSPQRQRERTLETLSSWLFAITNSGPALWIVEDLHWADHTTLEFIRSVLASNSGVSILVLLTFRPEFEPSWPESARSTIVSLSRLATDDTSSMIARVANNKPLPAAVLRQIIERTEGVPLFVEEVTKAVLELGVLEELTDRYELNRPLPPDLIPSTVQGSLIARLDRLGTAKPVAQLASTIGREFRFDILCAVSPDDEPTLRASLDRILSAELIFQVGVAPDERYLFKHALIQDAAYQSVLKKSRREIHGRIAYALTNSARADAESHPEVVAEHFTRAGQNEPAVQHWLRAGQLAGARAANHEAIAHLKRGLELLDDLPEAGRLELELELLVALAPAIMQTQGWASPELDRTYRRSNELVQLLGTTPHLLLVLSGTFGFHLVAGRITQSLALAEQVLQVAKQVGDPALLIVGHANCCVARCYQGDLRLAVEHAQTAHPLSTPEREQWIMRGWGQSLSVCVYCYEAEALWMLGFPEQALRASDRSVSLSRSMGNVPSMAFALSYRAWFYHLLRDVPRILESAEEGISLAREEGFAFWEPVVEVYRGWAVSAQGNSDEGLTILRDGLARYRSAGNGIKQGHMLCVLADALWSAGNHDEALQALAEGMSLATMNGEGFYEPELYRLRGEFLDDTASIHEALALARGQEARSLELRAAMSLCRVHRKRGDASTGRQLLAEVYATFTEGFDTADLRDARALLAELTR